jgi:hypothetical protein
MGEAAERGKQGQRRLADGGRLLGDGRRLLGDGASCAWGDGAGGAWGIGRRRSGGGAGFMVREVGDEVHRWWAFFLRWVLFRDFPPDRVL